MSKALFFAVALATATSFSSFSLVYAAENNTEQNAAKSVVVSGTGGTRELALGNAFRHAIEQAVGMMVTSESYVKNLKDIQDKIIVGSSGFIETYKILNEDHDVTGHAITISAVVRQQKLQEKVSETVGDTKPIDGGLLFAQQSSIEDQVKLYQATYDQLISDFATNGILYQYEGQPIIEKTGEDQYSMTLKNFTISIKDDWLASLEKYRAIMTDADIYDKARTSSYNTPILTSAYRCSTLFSCLHTNVSIKDKANKLIYTQKKYHGDHGAAYGFGEEYSKTALIFLLGSLGKIHHNRNIYPNLTKNDKTIYKSDIMFGNISSDIISKASSITFRAERKQF